MSELNEKQQAEFIEDVKYILARNGEQPLSRLRATMCQGNNRLESLGGHKWRLGNWFYHGEMEDLLETAGVVIRVQTKKGAAHIRLAVFFSVTPEDEVKYKALPDRPYAPGFHRMRRPSRPSVYDLPEMRNGGLNKLKPTAPKKPYGLKWGDDNGTVITREYEKESDRLRQVVALAGNDNVTWTESFKN